MLDHENARICAPCAIVRHARASPRVLLEEVPLELRRARVCRAGERSAAATPRPAVRHPGEGAELDLAVGGAPVVDVALAISAPVPIRGQGRIGVLAPVLLRPERR